MWSSTKCGNCLSSLNTLKTSTSHLLLCLKFNLNDLSFFNLSICSAKLYTNVCIYCSSQSTLRKCILLNLLCSASTPSIILITAYGFIYYTFNITSLIYNPILNWSSSFCRDINVLVVVPIYTKLPCINSSFEREERWIEGFRVVWKKSSVKRHSFKLRDFKLLLSLI